MKSREKITITAYHEGYHSGFYAYPAPQECWNLNPEDRDFNEGFADGWHDANKLVASDGVDE